MCGFVGWVDTRQGVDLQTLETMRDTIRHRGPDDAGLYRSPDRQVGLGFRRLSIIDLSPAGHQPMSNEDATCWIVFNGEVYNFAELRPELEACGHRFRSRTDTEVILHAYEEWGERCVEKFVGMFAFVIWDARKRTLFAARDRLGIKPFYYLAGNDGIMSASELKPLIASPGFDETIDLEALREYLARGYVCAPRSIFKAVRSLPPAHTLTWRAAGRQVTLRRYWNPLDFCAAPPAGNRTDQDYADELDELVRSAVRYRLISDVPLGAFLSGGIDSSLVVAMMRQVSSAEVKTFTIGFYEDNHNEATFAETIARHLGTSHTQLMVTHDEAKQVVALLPEYYDEPFADSSQIPTYLVSKLTRRHVTVSLSGDGGDELFCGYQNYQRMARWQRFWQIPQPIRSLISRSHPLIRDERLRLAARGLGMPGVIAFADYFANIWRPHEIDALAPDLRYVGGTAAAAASNGAAGSMAGMGTLEQLMLIDLQRYLPNDILTKVDRASMAVALEARVPLLDHRVVQFALGLPLHYKRRDGVSKYILRQVLYRYVPQALVDRPKQGFGVPLDDWLRRDLRDLVDHYLDARRIAQVGIFDPAVVQSQVERFMAGRCGHARVWSLLMFQMWFERHKQAQGACANVASA